MSVGMERLLAKYPSLLGSLPVFREGSPAFANPNRCKSAHHKGGREKMRKKKEMPTAYTRSKGLGSVTPARAPTMM